MTFFFVKEDMKKFSVVTICFLLYTFHVGASSYEMQLFDGQEVNKFVSYLAEQRVTHFAPYPYLYVASLEDDLPYSRLFFQCKDSAIIIVYYNNQPIGCITGVSCGDIYEYYKDSITFFDPHPNLSDYYYIGDVIILPEHRNKGLCRQLFTMLEEHAKKMGYTKICLISESHEQHPLKPSSYLEYEVLWKKLGYDRMHAFMQSSWVTLQVDGSCKNQEHTLEFWHKGL